MKLCINCKNLKHESYRDDKWIYEKFYCEKGSTKYKDCVSGKNEYNNHVEAYDMRNDKCKCGIEGKWFEERTDFWYKLIKWLKRSK